MDRKMKQSAMIETLKVFIKSEDLKDRFKNYGLNEFLKLDSFCFTFGKVDFKKEVLKECDADGDRIFQRIYWFEKFQCYVVAEGYYILDEGYFFDQLYISEPREVKVIQWKKI